MNRAHVRTIRLLLCLGAIVPVITSGEGYSGDVVAKPLVKTGVTSSGEKIEYPRTDKPEVTAMMVEIPPGGETGWHLHPVPVYAYIISGTLEVTLKNGIVNLYREGDAFVEPLNMPQNGRNKGAAPVKLVAFYTGSVGTANTVKVKEKERKTK